jgi:hypothetical protein
VLFALLLGTNGYWLYRLTDLGVSLSYAAQEASENQEALDQSFAVVRALAKGADRPAIVQAARGASRGAEPFEKEGVVWVGQIGLKFGPNDQLLEVVRTLSYK